MVRAQWRTGEATIAELVSKYGVHQTLINTWRRKAIEGMAGVFSGKAEAAAAERDGEVEKLHAKIGQLVVERDFLATDEEQKTVRWTVFPRKLRTMSVARRREMIEPRHPVLSVSRQCALVGISRSAFYGPAKGESPLNLALMRLIDAQFLETPGQGSRQMARHLRREGHVVGRKRVRRLMRRMGLTAVYQKPRTTVPHPEHRTWRSPLSSDHVWTAPAGQGLDRVLAVGRSRPCIRRLICSTMAARPDEVRRRSGPNQWRAL